MKVDFNQIPWEQAAPGLKFQAFEKDGQRIRIVEFQEEFIEPNWCTKGHIGYVIEGELQINLAGEITTFRAGDGLFIPPGSKFRHKHHATKRVTRLFLVEVAGPT